MFIYLIVNRVTGKYYVGQHRGKYLQRYLHGKFYEAEHNLGKHSRLYNSMRKYGRVAFTIHALISDVQTKTELDQYERDFITFLRSQDPDYGYNICRGGEGFTGAHSTVTREKIGVASKRIWATRSKVERRLILAIPIKAVQSPEVREKVVQQNKKRTGEEATFATLKKLHDSHMGIGRDEASCRKQSQSVTGAKNHFFGKTHSKASREKMREQRAVVQTHSNCPRHGRLPVAFPHSKCPGCKLELSNPTVGATA